LERAAGLFDLGCAWLEDSIHRRHAFTLITIGLLLYARSIVAAGKLSMPATMNELRNDRDAFLG